MKRDEVLSRVNWADWVKSNTPKKSADSPPLRKYLTTTIEKGQVNPETGMQQFTFVASTEAVDREGDVIMASGWNLDNYLKNPVILYGHDYWSFPIGRAVDAKLADAQLKITVDFTPKDVNEDGYRAYKLVEGGYLNAVSVGFQPIKYMWNESHNGYDFEQQDLLEVSVVPVPANAEALLAASLQGVTGEERMKMLDLWNAIAGLKADDLQGGATPNDGTAPQILYCSTINDQGDSGDAPILSFTTSSGDTVSMNVWSDNTFTVPYGGTGDGWYRGTPTEFVFPETVVITYDEATKEADMDEKVIEELTAAVKDLVGVVRELHERIESLEEKQSDPPEDEPTEDDVREIVRSVMEDIELSRTGRLPE